MYLGLETATPEEEQLFRQLYALSKQYFPEETGKAEAWLQAEATKYGLVYSKMKAEETGRSVWNNPLTWVGLGLTAIFLLRR